MACIYIYIYTMCLQNVYNAYSSGMLTFTHFVGMFTIKVYEDKFVDMIDQCCLVDEQCRYSLLTKSKVKILSG